jgi:ribosomal protein S18 acetylase RimI-like enzyme
MLKNEKMKRLNLYQLTKKDLQKASMVLSRTFLNDPIMSYYFPDKTERKQLAPLIWRFLLKDCLQCGEVYAPSSQLEGIAGWLPPEKTYMTTWRAILAGGIPLAWHLEKNVMNRINSVVKFADKIHKNHVICCPHYYLVFIGIEPELQGKGYGSMLLKSMFSRANKERLPIYLETNNNTNVSFYQQLGFEILYDGFIPGTEIPHWAMMWWPSVE